MGARSSRVFVRPDFVPWRDVPQLAAGEVWIPDVGVTVADPLLWAGRNGTNTLTSPGAQIPTASTGPGGNPDWTFSAAASSIFNVASPAGPLTATDGVYVAGDFRFDSLDTTLRCIVEQHGGAGSRKWNFTKTASNNVLQINVSQDGTALQTAALANLESEGVGTLSILDKYLFFEFVCDCTITSSLAAQTRLWLERQQVTFSSHTGSILTSLFNGGVLRIGNNVSDNQDFNGRYGRLFIGKRANGRLLPTDDHRRQIQNYLNPKDRRVQVILRGNSLTQGQGASVPGTTSFPAVFKAAFATAGYVGRDVHDRGIGGLKSSDALNAFFTNEYNFVDRVFDRSVLTFFEVRNSTQANVPPETILNEHLAYIARAKGAGFWVLAGTAPPSAGAPAGSNTAAGNTNVLLRNALPTVANSFIDLEFDPVFSAGGHNSAVYDADGVHMNDAGQARLSDVMLAKIIT